MGFRGCSFLIWIKKRKVLSACCNARFVLHSLRLSGTLEDDCILGCKFDLSRVSFEGGTINLLSLKNVPMTIMFPGLNKKSCGFVFGFWWNVTRISPFPRFLTVISLFHRAKKKRYIMWCLPCNSPCEYSYLCYEEFYTLQAGIASVT